MLVRDLPFAFNPLEAKRLPKPKIGLCSVRLFSLHPIQAMTEGNIGVYHWLDRAPKGRNEAGVWWRRHDEYDNQPRNITNSSREREHQSHI